MAAAQVSPPEVVSPSAWLTARTSLLSREKELTKTRDAVALERRTLPITAVTKPYEFTALDGSRKSLADLFAGRRQLIIYHFMFGPDDAEGCSSCSMMADSFPPHLEHLHSRDTSFALVSRAPADKIAAFQARMGWSFPWYSSFGGTFNYDFHTTNDEAVAPVAYNFQDKDALVAKGLTYNLRGEQPCISTFIMGKAGEGAQEDGVVYHSYSAYARGLDHLISTYSLLELTPLGRQDGNSKIGGFMHHDKYGKKEE